MAEELKPRENNENDALGLESMDEEGVYFRVHYGGEEYSVIITEPTGEPDDLKIFWKEHKEGPEIYIDSDVPNIFWPVALVHEIEERKALREEEGKSGRESFTLNEMEQMKLKAHEIAVKKEKEYAARHLTPELYKEYLEWRKKFVEKE